jgi:hypothetical protein
MLLVASAEHQRDAAASRQRREPAHEVGMGA